MLAVFGILLLLFFALGVMLFKVMFYKAEDYKNMAKRQWTSKVKIDAKRGKVLDRNLNELAVSGNVYRIDLDLKALKEGISKNLFTFQILSEKLSEPLGMEKEEVLNSFTKKGADGKDIGYSILKRRVEEDAVTKVRAIIKELKVNGIIISPDTKRFYPNKDFASTIIGHTNTDGKGLTGIELYYDKYLSGVPGEILEERDALKQELPFAISEYFAPVDGKDVVLTIDDKIQYFAEKYAKQALTDNKAKAVSIIVMNPNNGEILAMANNPGYDLNNPWADGTVKQADLFKLWRNRAVSDAMEPGSIFKVVTATAALEEGIVKSGDQYICNCDGSFHVAGSTIHCWKRTGHGKEDFIHILENSCNVGFGTLGAQLGAENLHKYIDLFGFGETTGIDLKGESNGIVIPAKKMGPVDVATVSFGQANTVSMVQYLTAFNAIANGGEWIRPHLMQKIVGTDSSGKQKVESEFDNFGKKRVVSEETSKQLRGFLEKVVTEGGSSKAYIEGYHIAGKTGTAQIPNTDGRGYASQKYLSSFAGMAPADNPQISVMIQILEPDPSNYYAGQIAAPVGKELFNDIFNYLAFRPTSTNEEVLKSMLKDVTVPEVRGLNKNDAIQELKSKGFDFEVDDAGGKIIDMSPKPGYVVKEGAKIQLYTGESSNYNKIVVVPNIKGYNRDKAKEALNALGLNASFSGSGMVSDQSIDQGTEVSIGTTIGVKLEIIGD